MPTMTKHADDYFTDGCGRCALGGTPQCKVHTWAKELAALRTILNESGLTEECKWGSPCYTYKNTNVILLGAFKDYCVISFLKGALLSDTEKLLKKPGDNSQSARVMQFTNVKQIVNHKNEIRNYIQEAIEVENAGLKVTLKKIEEYKLPVELEQTLKKNAALKKAWQALTPGRQRGYLIHFSQPKQSATRQARIDKCIKLILKGEGMHDGYKKKK